MMEDGRAGRLVAAEAEDVRVQYRLAVKEGPTGFGDESAGRVGIAVDVETTAPQTEDGAIIELGMRRFRFDADGIITHIDLPYSWREQPSGPVPEQTTKRTGLRDIDVIGCSIDDAVATRLIRTASLVVAHNAAFDRPWIERRLPGASGMDWACSMQQIDWLAHGFDGRSLGYLLRQAGWFNEERGVGANVDAVIQLLRHRTAGRTALSLLVAQAERPSWRVRACGAAFEVRTRLKERGYSWNPDMKVWWREVDDDARMTEEFWLAENVYSAAARPSRSAPDIERITAAERFL